MNPDLAFKSREQVIADALRAYSREATRTTRAKAVEAALVKWDEARSARINLNRLV